MAFVIKTADPEQKLDLAAWGITPSSYETPSEGDLRHLYSGSLKEVEEGKILTGRIVAVRPQHVLVDVGLKSEGVISRDEFAEGEDIRIGQEIEVLLVQREDREGTIQLSKAQADKQRSWEKMLVICDGDGRVTGTITRKVKGGLMVNLNGIDAFLPS